MTVDATGLTIKTLAELREEMRDDARAAFGAGVQLGADSVFGQLIDLVADIAATNYEALQGVYDAFDPDAASGVNLDSLASLTGITREAARASVAVLTLTGTPATLIPLGTLVRVPNGPTFATSAAVIIGGGGTVDVSSTATVTGPLEAVAGSITEIVTPVVGLSSVTNALDAVVGRNIETDQEFRSRRVASQQAKGAATDPAIRAALLALLIVDQALVISNRTLAVDAFGIPPKAFRAIVWPDPGVYPADVAIFETIYQEQPAGIESDGARSATVTDSQGFSQTIKYSVATELRAVIDVTLLTGAGFPIDGNDQVTAAIVAATAGLDIGADLYRITSICAAASVPGVLGATVLQSIFPAAPAAADLTADIDEIITVDLVDITVS